MIFRKRLERAFTRSRENREQHEAAGGKPADGEELSDSMEKGDLFAMISSGLLIVLPIALGVLLLLAAVGYFFVFR